MCRDRHGAVLLLQGLHSGRSVHVTAREYRGHAHFPRPLLGRTRNDRHGSREGHVHFPHGESLHDLYHGPRTLSDHHDGGRRLSNLRAPQRAVAIWE